MTEVELLNKALGYLGEAPVLSLTQKVTSARAGASAMRQSVEEVLRQQPWNSALKRATLARLIDENAFGPRYSYQLPSDYVKLVEYNDDVNDYRIEGNRIVTDDDVAEILYVAYPADFSVLDAGLIEVLAAKLAFNIAMPVTANAAIQNGMLELSERMLARARTMDARESSHEGKSLYAETLRDSPMIQRRRYSSRTSPTRNRTTS